jgi:hypothetical protein
MFAMNLTNQLILLCESNQRFALKDIYQILAGHTPNDIHSPMDKHMPSVRGSGSTAEGNWSKFYWARSAN